MDIRNPVAGPLLGLRLGVFIVMLMWTLDKLVNPTHAANVFANFYGLGGFGPLAFPIIGVVELIVIGVWTYGAVLVLHAVSTISSYRQ